MVGYILELFTCLKPKKNVRHCVFNFVLIYHARKHRLIDGTYTYTLKSFKRHYTFTLTLDGTLST